MTDITPLSLTFRLASDRVVTRRQASSLRRGIAWMIRRRNLWRGDPIQAIRFNALQVGSSLRLGVEFSANFWGSCYASVLFALRRRYPSSVHPTVEGLVAEGRRRNEVVLEI